MKMRNFINRNCAFTLFDALVIVLAICLLVLLILPILARAKIRVDPINCVSNLKQVNLAFRIWEGDHNNNYPMAVSVTNGGAMEVVATGDVATCFFVMSNELSTPKVLVCPEDKTHTCATNWWIDFNRSHISYFVGVDADESRPERIMSGDDNFAMNGIPVKSGLFEFSTNESIAWGPGRHGDTDVPHHFWTPPPSRFIGNLGYADGSVAELSDAGLQQSIILTSLATNRFAIP